MHNCYRCHRRDFVADAYAHYKFVAFTDAVLALFAKAGLPEALDEGFVLLGDDSCASDSIARCSDLRFWDRVDAADARR